MAGFFSAVVNARGKNIVYNWEQIAFEKREQKQSKITWVITLADNNNWESIHCCRQMKPKTM